MVIFVEENADGIHGVIYPLVAEMMKFFQQIGTKIKLD